MDGVGEAPPGFVLERLAQLGVHGHDVVRLGPWNVARATGPGGQLPQTVIVKWRRPDLDTSTSRALLNAERQALRLVSATADGLVPELLAEDDDLLLLEDLAGPSLHEMLLGSAGTSSAAEGQKMFAVAMARVHAETARRSAELAPAGIGGDLAVDRSGGASFAAASWIADHLGQSITAASSDLAIARAHLDDPGPFMALSNGDPGANNFVVTRDGGRLIDFERARYRHALEDAASLCVQHSVWMTIERPSPGLIDTYRVELAKSIDRAADDDAFFGGLAAAAASRALHRLERAPTLDARQPGHPSRPQLIATVDAATSSLEECGRFPALRSWFAAVGGQLRVRWPDADRQFPDAFTV